VSAVELSGGPPKPGLVNAASLLSPPAIVKQVAMAAAVVVTLVTGADHVARAVRLYRSPAPPAS